MAASSTNTKASFLRWVADNLVLPSGSKLAIPYYAPTHAHTHTHTHKLSFWKVSSFLSSSPVAVSLVVGTVVLAAVVGGQRRKG